MCDNEELELRISVIEDIEAIKKLPKKKRDHSVALVVKEVLP